MRERIALLARRLLLALIAAGSSVATPAQEVSPDAVFRETLTAIVRRVEAERPALEQDVAAVHALVREYLLPRFDFYAAGSLILLEHWPTAQSEQDRFVDSFYRYLEAGYGDLLIHFTDETFTVLGVNGDVVETMLKRSDRENLIAVDLLTIKRGAERPIVDVIADGSSYVGTYRQQFNGPLVRGGFEGLIDFLERRTALLREKRGLPAEPPRGD